MIEEARKIVSSFEAIQSLFQKAGRDYSEFCSTFRTNLKPLYFVDAKDSYKKWRLGQVISISKSGYAKIHFDGWDSKWDEVLSLALFLILFEVFVT